MTDTGAAPIPTSPYRGIHPFRYRERALFFGREAPVSTLLVKVMLSRFVILFGESGTGKSSMLNAGLVAALQKEDFRVERLLIQPDGPIVVERLEGDAPGSFLPSIFAAPDRPSAARIACDLDRFARVVRASTAEIYPVLIFDQFEQLFTLFDRKAQQAQRAILDAIFALVNDETLRVKVVISIREDFLAKLEMLANDYPRVFDNRVHLQQLDAKHANQAIRKPFLHPNRFPSQLSEDLAGVLVKELAAETATGLVHPTHLQIVCSRLWDEFADKQSQIGTREYEMLAGVPGIISGYLESKLGGLDAARRAQVVWCLGRLITESGTRDVVSEGKLCDLLVARGTMELASLKDALAFLEKQRLVNTTPRRDTLYYEIASEYLIPPVRRELQALRLEEERQQLARREREETDRRETETKLRAGARYKRLSRWLFGAVGVALVAAVVAVIKSNTADIERNAAQIERNAARDATQKAELRELEAKQAEAHAHRSRLEAEDAREREAATLNDKLALEKAARQADRVREEAVRLARQEEERRALTSGQLERLRKMQQALNPGEVLPKGQREAVLDSVANFLWSRGQHAELQTVLRGADDLFPSRYGIDEDALANLLFVDDSRPWPLELHYSAASSVDELLLLYHWKGMAKFLASTWGVPVAPRLKLVLDRKLPTHQFRLVANSSEEGKPPSRLETQFSVRTEPDQVVVEDPGPHSEQQPLKRFLDQYGQGEVDLKSAKIDRTYFLVPKWTQPVWKVAGHTSFSREGLIALMAASRMLEQPEFLVTSDAARLVLQRVGTARPKTLDEALATRGGFSGLRADMRQIVRRDTGLVHLEFLLDLLASYPGLSSVEAVDLALKAQDRLPDAGPRRLPGRQRGVEVPRASLESKAPFQYVYDETTVWLPPIEKPIRVLIGSGIERELIRGGEISPRVQEAFTQLRAGINERFGFIPPSVNFRREKLEPHEFRIEILNQTYRHEDTRPIPAPANQALATLVDELEFRYLAARDWWLHADEVNKRLTAVPRPLRTWLLQRYTLTDLKLLLQAQVAPSVNELAAYTAERGAERYAAIPRDGTIQDLPWLLGSLAFWATTAGDTANIEATVAWLRRVQRARFESVTTMPRKKETLDLVQKGIDRLAAGDIDEARGSFNAAVAADRRGAGDAFIALYAEHTRPAARLAKLEKQCDLPSVGSVATDIPPSDATRYELEQLLNSSPVGLPPDRRRALELCLLWIYADAKHAGSAERVIASLLPQPKTPEEEYLLAGLMLRLHGKSIGEPPRMADIRRLLSSSMRRLSVSDAEAVFVELLKKHEGQLPVWYVKLLLPLSDLQATSFTIPSSLAFRLASGSSLEEAGAALTLLGKAESRTGVLKADERDRIAALILYFRGRASLTFMQFGKRAAHADIQKMALAIKTREEKGWPSQDDVTLLLINALLYADQLAEATKASDDWVRRVPASQAALENAIFMRLANLDVSGALSLAKSGRAKGEKLDPEVAYKTALLELLSGGDGYEASARYFLVETDHPYREYIRLMLFWRLGLEHRGNEARKLIDDRWAQIDSSSWKSRLQGGDPHVWREMLVGYFAGQVRRDEIVGPVVDQGKFQAEPLSAIGMPFPELRGEAYLYDALMQEVSGDPATRRERSQRALNEVVRLRLLPAYEYHIARYLLSDTARKGRR